MLTRFIQLLVLGLLMMRPRPTPPPIFPPTPGGDDKPTTRPPGPPPGVDEDDWNKKLPKQPHPEGPPSGPPGFEGEWPPKRKTPLEKAPKGIERESILDRIRESIKNFDPKWVLMSSGKEQAGGE